MTTALNTQMAGVGQIDHAPLWRRLLGGYEWLANRELLACVAILVLTLGLRAALLPWIPIPQPVFHDEFSYLLAADTYAHGRLANSPHPFWQHFETMHELQQPTYSSKYQPLQGLVLAFGQRVFGEPWIGVYLSSGLMCAAICWMLQGWIAPDLALLGALGCVLRVGVLSYWMNSYYGGAVPGIGGALALGALARIWRRKQFAHSITWAAGVSLLALSRPYDAAVLGGATAAQLLWLLLKSKTPMKTICGQVALPALVILALCAAVICYNDYRVVGRPLTLPVQAYDQQYVMAPMFTLLPMAPEPQYRHPVIRQFYAGWNAQQWIEARKYPLLVQVVKLYSIGSFFLPFLVLLGPMLLFPYNLDTEEEQQAVYLLVVALLMILPLIAVQPHYVAVFAAVLYLRFLHSLTHLWRWRPWNKPLGKVLGVLLAALLVGDGMGLTAARDITSQIIASRVSELGPARHAIIQALEQQTGDHLVLVSYAAEHNPNIEWVYNRADIDASRIVWAHEMGAEQDVPFIEYFRSRRVWLLEPDRTPPRLIPYVGKSRP